MGTTSLRLMSSSFAIGAIERPNTSICDVVMLSASFSMVMPSMTSPSNDCTQDCSGAWGGSLVLDECGVCDGSGPLNDNTNCDGTCGGVNGAVEDCLGVCGGDAVVDDCNVCNGSGAPENFNCDGSCAVDVGCDGVCGSGVTNDDCGICDGDNSSCADCEGTANGNAAVDECGVCDADSSNDCTQDCAGVWGGGSLPDDCGICNGDNSSCADCAGDPNGLAVIDTCGICDADDTNDCTFDILYSSSSDFAGFQFNLEGVVSVSGGASEDAGWLVSTGASVLGFDITGDSPISAGSGVFVTVQLAPGSLNPCISNIIASDPVGNELNVSSSECLTIVID